MARKSGLYWPFGTAFGTLGSTFGQRKGGPVAFIGGIRWTLNLMALAFFGLVYRDTALSKEGRTQDVYMQNCAMALLCFT